jgi:ribosome modulation factor
MSSAYEHGQNAARHGKHIQACPFDTGTAEWQEWRDGFRLSVSDHTQRSTDAFSVTTEQSAYQGKNSRPIDREALEIEAHTLKRMWHRVVCQFASSRCYDLSPTEAERSYDDFEVAVEQFMRDATEAGYFSPIAGLEESELKRHEGRRTFRDHP